MSHGLADEIRGSCLVRISGGKQRKVSNRVIRRTLSSSVAFNNNIRCDQTHRRCLIPGIVQSPVQPVNMEPILTERIMESWRHGSAETLCLEGHGDPGEDFNSSRRQHAVLTRFHPHMPLRLTSRSEAFGCPHRSLPMDGTTKGTSPKSLFKLVEDRTKKEVFRSSYSTSRTWAEGGWQFGFGV